METAQVSYNKRIAKQMWYIHTMESYLTMRRNKLIIYTTAGSTQERFVE